MMDHHLTIVLAVVAGIVGFASYCIAAALHVWRSRTRNSNSTTTRFDRTAKRASLLIFAIGCICMFVVIVQHFVIVREGVLQGENLAAIRAREGFEVVWTTPKDALSSSLRTSTIRTTPTPHRDSGADSIAAPTKASSSLPG